MSVWNSIFIDFIIGQLLILYVCVCKTTVFHTIVSVMLLLKSVYTSS